MNKYIESKTLNNTNKAYCLILYQTGVLFGIPCRILFETLFQKYAAIVTTKHMWRSGLTLFDMGFFEPLVMGGGGGGEGGMRAPHHNFVVIAPMIMKFGTDIKLDVF